MKKFLAILLMLAMLLTAFVACKGEGEETTAAPEDTQAPAGVSIDDAVEYLTSMYKSDEGKKTPADIEIKTLIPAVSYNKDLCAQLGITVPENS